jgi:DNA ligase-1
LRWLLRTNARSCKHLKDHLGDEFEEWRCGPSGLAPVKVEKTNAPKLLLANKWEESTDPVGYWVSEKLDGVRAFWNGKYDFVLFFVCM